MSSPANPSPSWALRLGKSTLLNLAGGLDKATGGQVFIEDAEIGSLTAGQLAALRRRRVGFVFQDFNLILPHGGENVALPLELDGTSARQARHFASDALDLVGPVTSIDRFPDKMSGGQQQRVAIARALVGDRRLVPADEPTGALDSHTGEGVLRVLRPSAATRGRPDSWSPTRHAMPPGPTGSSSSATASSSTPRVVGTGRRPSSVRATDMTTLTTRPSPRHCPCSDGLVLTPAPLVASWRISMTMARRDALRYKGRSA